MAIEAIAIQCIIRKAVLSSQHRLDGISDYGLPITNCQKLELGEQICRTSAKSAIINRE